jgi:transcriptional regulator with XRE-family HTH domain
MGMRAAPMTIIEMRHDGQFGARVKRRRLQQAMSQRDLAEQTEIPKRTISEWEQNRAVPFPGKRMKRLCDVLRTTPMFLWFGEEEDK